jgi:ACS family hexuronate transporter-like MFS transporter
LSSAPVIDGGTGRGALHRIAHLRWWIAGLLAMATAINYLDRQSFPVVVGEVRKHVPISDQQYGNLTSIFLLAYGIMYAGGGRIMDKFGTRVGYTIVIVWWSAATLLTGFVSSVLQLGICRFMLGMGEGGGFPGSAKAIAEWFPARERAMAFGIFNTGSSVGAVIAPPLMALIASSLGWRAVFFISGAVGFFWVWLWLMLYQPPAKNRYVTPQELQMIETDHANQPRATAVLPWLSFFRFKEVLGLMGAKFVTDAAWYFFIFWLPKYLGDVRHLNIKQIGYFAWIPYAFAGVGSFGGGWLSSYLLKRGYTLNAARKIALGFSACLLPVSLLIISSPLSLAIVFFSMAMFAHQFWSANVQTLPADLFPSSMVGSVGGLLGCAGSFGGMIFGVMVGWLVEHSGYGPAFVVAGLCHPLGFLLVLATVRRVEQVDLRRAST